MRGHDIPAERLLYPSIPISFIADVLEAAHCRGWDVEALLLENGLSLQGLKTPGIRISIVQYGRILRQLGEMSNDAFFGFLSRPVPLNALPVFCYSMVGCRNVVEFVEHSNAFYGLFTNEFSWYLERDAGDLVVGVNLTQALPLDYRFIIHSLMLMSVRLFGWLLGEDPEIKAVTFTHTKNPSDDSLTYLFGNGIEYACDANTIRIDGRYEDGVLSCTREQVKQLLFQKRYLFLMTRNEHPLSQEVRRMLLTRKQEVWLEAEEVAAKMNMSANQLWRRLKKEGNSFLDIRDQIKRDWALILLEDPANTVELVAEQLRYSDVSAFRKAFKKWTGLQPAQYRRVLSER